MTDDGHPITFGLIEYRSAGGPPAAAGVTAG